MIYIKKDSEGLIISFTYMENRAGTEELNLDPQAEIDFTLNFAPRKFKIVDGKLTEATPAEQINHDNKPSDLEVVQQTLGTLAKQVVDLSISKSTLTQADSVLAQQIVQLTDQNKKLQQAVATLVVQVVQAKGGK